MTVDRAVASGLTEAEMAEIREYHVTDTRNPVRCWFCNGRPFPCPTLRALDELERLRAENERLAADLYDLNGENHEQLTQITSLRAEAAASRALVLPLLDAIATGTYSIIPADPPLWPEGVFVSVGTWQRWVAIAYQVLGLTDPAPDGEDTP